MVKLTLGTMLGSVNETRFHLSPEFVDIHVACLMEAESLKRNGWERAERINETLNVINMFLALLMLLLYWQIKKNNQTWTTSNSISYFLSSFHTQSVTVTFTYSLGDEWDEARQTIAWVCKQGERLWLVNSHTHTHTLNNRYTAGAASITHTHEHCMSGLLIMGNGLSSKHIKLESIIPLNQSNPMPTRISPRGGG